ncbi:MAG: tetraacyldisaccharide 4'-kinase [Bacteroidales bacterium]|nr:tetraacyldisaccharide 4'-kinase [Bacteroidales bacterium]
MLKILLKILSGFYYLITSVRNFFYDSKVIKSHEFFAPVISVGNITVGGTGKTPHTEYIVNLLKDDFTVTVLSRGYKRKTTGYVDATKDSTVAEIGDEPKQMVKKFSGQAFVAVCESRVHGILKILKKRLDNQIIVLDDAYQHRAVTPLVSILLVDYNRPVYEDHLLPYGRLRESSKGTSRAHIIIVTKCPDEIKPIEKNIIAKNMNRLPFQSVYFTNFKYSAPKKVFSEAEDTCEITKDTEILLITGIANTKVLENYVKKNLSEKITQLKFSDHHNFKAKDIQKIVSTFSTLSSKKVILTTEKDAVRLEEIAFAEEIKKKMYYLPIEVNFLSDEDAQKFNQQILKYVTENKADYRLHTTVR